MKKKENKRKERKEVAWLNCDLTRNISRFKKKYFGPLGTLSGCIEYTCLFSPSFSRHSIARVGVGPINISC